MKKLLALLLTLCMACTLLASVAMAAGSGWKKEEDGWRYYNADGSYLTGVVLFRSGDKHYRFLFSSRGYLLTGDDDGEVFLGGHRYYLNPNRRSNQPSTYWAVSDYTRVTPNVGVTYYDSNGLSYAGWLKRGEKGEDLVYQTVVRRAGQKDLCIFVTGAQYIPESLDPNYPASYGVTIPAGRYFFDGEGRLVQREGWYMGGDGYLYHVTNRGQVIWQGAVANERGALANRQTAEQMQSSLRPMQQNMLNLINNARISSGSTVVSLRDSLCLAATMRAMEMARLGSTAHTRPDGTGWETILFTVHEMEEMGASIAAERDDGGASVLRSLYSSDTKYRYFGVGSCTNPNGETFYAIIFSEQGGSVLK